MVHVRYYQLNCAAIESILDNNAVQRVTPRVITSIKLICSARRDLSEDLDATVVPTIVLEKELERDQPKSYLFPPP